MVIFRTLEATYSMNKFIMFFKRFEVWLWVIAIYLIYKCICMLLSLAPAFLFVVHGNDPITDVASGFQWYIEEAATSFSISQKDVILRFIYNGFTSLISVAMVPFLIKRRNWARKILLGLIIMMLFSQLLSYIYIYSYGYGIPILHRVDTFLYTGIVIFLFLPSVSRIFRKETIGGESGTEKEGQ
jgi:hypothetical protein